MYFKCEYSSYPATKEHPLDYYIQHELIASVPHAKYLGVTTDESYLCVSYKEILVLAH